MTLFLRLLDSENKEDALAAALAQVRDGAAVGFEVQPDDFAQVPGSPFAYWFSQNIRDIFQKLTPLENAPREARRGSWAGDDFRYLRIWTEVKPHSIGHTIRWSPFAKGGNFSKFYYDFSLVVDWDDKRKTFHDFYGRPGRETERPESLGYYFRPGVTWPLRSQRGFSSRVLPKGFIFANVSPSIFDSSNSKLMHLLGLVNSRAFRTFLDVSQAFGAYQVGVIQRTPVPNLENADGERLGQLALACVMLKRDLDRVNETSHVFHLPALLQVEGATLAERMAAWAVRVRDTDAQLANNQAEIDKIAFRMYGIDPDELGDLNHRDTEAQSLEDAEAEDDVEANNLSNSNAPWLCASVVSYILGCVFGRWDIRFATGERGTPELSDPFAPLPAYSPGMLRSDADALPALRPDEDGILADDEGNPADIVRQVRIAFDIIWGDRAEAIEREIVAVLGVKDLRDYFQKKGKGGFWLDHIQRYSKSRRKAPIYWLLQSPKGKYGLWLYYPKLNGDTLAKALTSYAEPKLRRELERLATLRAEVQSVDGSARRTLEREVERQEDLLNDIQEFRDRLERVTRRGLRPDHNDGVLLTIAPLWELTPWAEAKRTWEELQAGKYEWSNISKQLRGEYVAEESINNDVLDQASDNVADEDTIKRTTDNDDESTKPVVESGPPRTILGRLLLRHVGPAAELDLQFDERINILTGDNGLGKTFVLDAAWLALTGVDPAVLLRPPTNIETTARASIAYEIVSTAGTVQEDNILYFHTKQDLWESSRPQATQGVTPRPGIVFFVQVDGTIAIWDRFKRAGLEKRGIGSALRFEGRELWEGKRHRSEQLSRGLIEDFREWWRAAAERDRSSPSTTLQEIADQAALFDLISNVLATLSPDEQNKLTIKAPVRISTIDTTEYPQIDMTYGDVPIVQASAAVQRILGLAYALVWAYREHRIAAALSDQEPSSQVIILIDEIELHLHPKWQRRILPALLTAIELLDTKLHAQIITTTHAPLVLASMEPHFKEEVDQLFDFDLVDGKVVVTHRIWAKQGDVSNWLVSESFNLAQARSPEAEYAIAAALAYMRGDNLTSYRFQNQAAIQRELSRLLPEHDPFWARWSLEGGEDEEGLMQEINKQLDKLLLEEDGQ